MQIAYTIYEQRYTPEDLEDGEGQPPTVEDSGTSGVADLLREAYIRYSIRPRTDNDGTLWWASEEPREDREYFEQGVQKLYMLHIHNLTARHFSRVNKMLKLLNGVKT